MIRITDARLVRGGHAALDGIDLAFGEGGITALIGPNGAGKSTLLHAMAGLLTPTSGSVEIAGMDVGRARPETRARIVALLPQSENVTARLSVGDLVGFGRWPHHRGRPGARDRTVMDEAIRTFDLAPLRDRVLDTLSGGQRQRAFVAMAWAQETPWMLLDEPLSALDPRHARDIMERLHALTRPGTGGRSVVIVLHDLAMAARYADRIVAMKDGRVVASGPKSLRLTSGLLSGLYDTPLSVETVAGGTTVVPA